MKTLTLLGAGKMGQAMLKGWIKSGLQYPITIIDPNFVCDFEDDLRAIGALINPISPAKADILVIGIKPQNFNALKEKLAALCKPETIVISIMAGINITSLQSLGAQKLFRIMPNTPGQIGEGISGIFGNSECGSKDFDLVIALLNPLGECVVVESEDQIDAVTAISGSGPAYVFLMAEFIARAGEKLGIDPVTSLKLAKATIRGAGQLMDKSPDHPSILRKNVTSPGGTTQAALNVLTHDDGFAKLIEEAIKAAYSRSQELSMSE